jgi:hypothetical protein
VSEVQAMSSGTIKRAFIANVLFSKYFFFTGLVVISDLEPRRQALIHGYVPVPMSLATH